MDGSIADTTSSGRTGRRDRGSHGGCTVNATTTTTHDGTMATPIARRNTRKSIPKNSKNDPSGTPYQSDYAILNRQKPAMCMFVVTVCQQLIFV
jgi:hypothetical protein